MCSEGKTSINAHILSQRKVDSLKNHKPILQQILDKTDLSEESLPGKPVVELLGDCRVLVENHRGITQYDLDRICIRVCYGVVAITGCNLQLRQMTGGKLLIVGMIQGVELIRGRQ